MMNSGMTLAKWRVTENEFKEVVFDIMRFGGLFLKDMMKSGMILAKWRVTENEFKEVVFDIMRFVGFQ
ncbi:hypothetical protein J6590_101755 [Homalodisca vitripennis]|nr:hypothetical protein J6590_101755 [Homalodisca vitripennis]